MLVTWGCDVLAFTEYYAEDRRQSRALGDGMELRGSDGHGAHGKRCARVLSPERETPLHVGDVRHGCNVR